MIRYLGMYLALFLMVGLVGYALYAAGKTRGMLHARRWSPIIEAVVEWRRQETYGNEFAAAQQLERLRQLADSEEDTLRKELRKLSD